MLYLPHDLRSNFATAKKHRIASIMICRSMNRNYLGILQGNDKKYESIKL